MRNLVEDFLQYLRHERGQSEQTQKTYSILLGLFLEWADSEGI
ncbi:MAG: site-specific recombinase XerD, partial [Limisphaerales bacterium]